MIPRQKIVSFAKISARTAFEIRGKMIAAKKHSGNNKMIRQCQYKCFANMQYDMVGPSYI